MTEDVGKVGKSEKRFTERLGDGIAALFGPKKRPLAEADEGSGANTEDANEPNEVEPDNLAVKKDEHEPFESGDNGIRRDEALEVKQGGDAEGKQDNVTAAEKDGVKHKERGDEKETEKTNSKKESIPPPKILRKVVVPATHTKRHNIGPATPTKPRSSPAKINTKCPRKKKPVPVEKNKITNYFSTDYEKKL